MNLDYMKQWYENAKKNTTDPKELEIIEAQYKLFLATTPKEK